MEGRTGQLFGWRKDEGDFAESAAQYLKILRSAAKKGMGCISVFGELLLLGRYKKSAVML